jgi:hypothetical protein
LLTVLAHELGHVIGRPHSPDAGQDVMAATLAPGVRLLPGDRRSACASLDLTLSTYQLLDQQPLSEVPWSAFCDRLEWESSAPRILHPASQQTMRQRATDIFFVRLDEKSDWLDDHEFTDEPDEDSDRGQATPEDSLELWLM